MSKNTRNEEPRLVKKNLTEIEGLSADKLDVIANEDIFFEDEAKTISNKLHTKGKIYKAVNVDPSGMTLLNSDQGDDLGCDHGISGEKWMSKFSAMV